MLKSISTVINSKFPSTTSSLNFLLSLKLKKLGKQISLVRCSLGCVVYHPRHISFNGAL
ncbi:hypothetical protein HanPSC8_Chr09g0366691 [Helianthus annuus]|nr:hypothetical protein HanPSC8_Chr09g0366691 [Helianthus annuus]